MANEPLPSSFEIRQPSMYILDQYWHDGGLRLGHLLVADVEKLNCKSWKLEKKKFGQRLSPHNILHPCAQSHYVGHCQNVCRGVLEIGKILGLSESGESCLFKSFTDSLY